MQKKLNKNRNLLTILLLVGISCLIFWKFFIYGLYPFPGDYMLAWYEPWKSSNFTNGTITISHKPIADDVFRQLYPFKILSMDLVKKLELPLWNPYNGAGMPLMATMHMGFLNPFNIFFLVINQKLAWTIYVITQSILAGFFTYLYSRKINFSKSASLFASNTFMFSGFIITRLIFGEYIYVFSMLPLILYIIESFMQNPYTKIVLFLPLIIFFLFVSGHPQMILYVILFSFGYILYRSNEIRKRLNLAFLFLLGIGLASLQLLPTLELFQNANITSSSSQFIINRFLLPPVHLLSILIPNYFGNQATYNYWGAGDYIETIASIGIIPCFFAYIAIICIYNKSKNRDIRKFFLFTLLITIISTLDWFGTRFFFSIPIPILSTGVPSRIFSLTTFSLAILGGYGFDVWLQSRKTFISPYKFIPFFILIIFISAGTFFFYINHISCNNVFIPACRLIALRNTFFEVGFFSLALIIFFWFQKSKKEIVVRVLPEIMILFIVLLGLYNSNKFLPFSKKETIMPENALIHELLERNNNGRVFGMGDANIKTDFASYYGFYDPNYYDPLYNRRYGELVTYANNGRADAALLRSDVEITNELKIDPRVENRRDRLLNLLGVSSLIFKKSEIPISTKNNTIWEDVNWVIKENTAALPHAYLVNKIEIITNDKNILKRLFDPLFDPKISAIVEEKINNFPESLPMELSEKVEITSHHENNITIKTETKHNRMLILSDNYYPGWKAFIDDRETKIFRANYTFRAIQLPPGEHIIMFLYDPKSFRLGAYLFLFSLFSYGVIVILWKKIDGNKNK